ncbi:MAG: exonuclease subunit SbcD [bacterium]|nr:exonuclease subunit SbcD [bacterium]
MMRIIHTSDWHLGKTLDGISRIQEQRDFIDELHQMVVEQNAHLVLIAGDIYDTFNPSAEAEDLFYYALEKLAENGRRGVVVIAGNHDNPERLSAPEYLARHHGITLVGFPKDTVSAGGAPGRVQRTASGPGWVRLQIPGCDHQATLVTLAYPSEARLGELFDLHFANDSLQQPDDQKIALDYRNKVKELLNLMTKEFRKDTVNIILSHLFYGQGITSDERILSIGGLNAIQATDLPSSSYCQYVALGHLHRPQSFYEPGYPVCYSGSPLAYSFSEAGQQKKVILIEAEPAREVKIVDLPLKSGFPLVRKTFSSYQEALAWCSQPENQNQWVDMKIIHPTPLSSPQTRELKSRHSRIVNLQAILPQQGEAAEPQIAPRRLAELSLIEKFIAFYKEKNANAEPSPELIDLFVELTENLEEADD